MNREEKIFQLQLAYEPKGKLVLSVRTQSSSSDVYASTRTEATTTHIHVWNPFYWEKQCDGRGLGPRLEAGPRLKKCGSPRGVVRRSWSVLLVGSFAVVVWSGASCSSSVVVLCVWLELLVVLLLLSRVEQVAPAQLLCFASGWSRLISDALLASPVQWWLWFGLRNSL